MKIDNSKESAVMSGSWSKPGASFYNNLMNEDNYQSLINEAFLISDDVDKDTTFAQSGCKYPHHVIKDGTLVVSAPGIKAAYSRARQMGVYKGDVKEHLDKHMRELGYLDKKGVHYEEIMEENFNYIESVIDSTLGTNLVMMESELQEYDEKSHGGLKYEFRFVIGEQNGHLYKIIYKLNPANITSDNLAKGDYLDKLQKNITRTGHGNYTSMGNSVIGIKDMCNGKQVNSVSAYPPIHNSGGNIMPVNKSKWMKQMSSFVKRGVFQQAKMDEYIAKYEKECPTGIWPAVGWEESIDDSKNNGQKPIVYTVGKVDNTDTYKTTKITNVLDGMLGLKRESSADFMPPAHEIEYTEDSDMDLEVKCKEDIKHPEYGYAYDQYTLLASGTPVSEAKYLKKEKFIYDIETYPSFRRKGYAEYLIRHLVSIGARHLNVGLNNTAAITLYKKIGFHDDGYVRGDNNEKLQRMTIDDDKAKKISDKTINEATNLADPYGEKYREWLMSHPDDTESHDLSEYIDEASHGTLKHSFRLCANAENGHLLRITFDLDPSSIMMAGDHTNQNLKQTEKLQYLRDNITKTGSGDFSSIGTVQGITDLDTGKPLQSADTVGIIGSDPNSVRFTVPDKYSDGSGKDFKQYPVSVREKIAAELNLKNSGKGVTRFTVGQKETRPSYKSTRAFGNAGALFNNQFTAIKGFHKPDKQELRHNPYARGNLDVKQNSNYVKFSNMSVEKFIQWAKSNMPILQKAANSNSVPRSKRFTIDDAIESFERIERVYRKNSAERITNVISNEKYSTLAKDIIDGINAAKSVVTESAETIEELETWTDTVVTEGWEAVDEFDEKSHGNLKYCYRIGYDIHTGTKVAIEFDLTPDAINSVGDKGLTKNAYKKANGEEITDKRLKEIHSTALDYIKHRIKKTGHIDFTTAALRVNAIFDESHKKYDHVEIIGLFSNAIKQLLSNFFFPKKSDGTIDKELSNNRMNQYSDCATMTVEGREIQVDKLMKKPEIRELVLSNKIQVESYTVGKISGENRYKTTKLIWDRKQFSSLKLTPVVRGVIPLPQNVKDPTSQKNANDYINNFLNNKYRSTHESVSVDDSFFIMTESPNEDNLVNDITTSDEWFLEQASSSYCKFLSESAVSECLRSLPYDLMLETAENPHEIIPHFHLVHSNTTNPLFLETLEGSTLDAAILVSDWCQVNNIPNCIIESTIHNGDQVYKEGCVVYKDGDKFAIAGRIVSNGVKSRDIQTILENIAGSFGKHFHTKDIDLQILEAEGSEILLPGLHTPSQLLSYMSNINYGWIGKNGEVYKDADAGDFFKDYALQSPDELIKSGYGVCWDQVEFERKWFSDNKYNFRTYFIVIDDNENKPSHTFLIYQDKNKVYWFENSWYDQRGIHVFNTLSEAMQEIFDKFNDSHHNKSDDVYIYNLPEMPAGIGCEEYYRIATDDSNLLKHVHMSNVNESVSEDNDITDKWFIRSDDGVDNCCISVKGYDKPMRGRSAMITLQLQEDDNWYILCKKNTDDYGVPGGGWNKDESPKHAAIRELQEETLSNVKNVKRMGTLIEYHDTVKDWVKEHVPNKDDWWYGYYSAIFVGIYDGKFTGKVKEEDRESGYTWKKIDHKLLKSLPKEYADAINEYINKDNPFKESVFEESKLQYDFRYGYDNKTGHMMKIVYELDSIKVDYAGHAYNPEDLKAQKLSINPSANKEVKNTIASTGNLDHRSHGQKVIKIVDMVTGENLDSANVLSFFAGGNVGNIGKKELTREEIKLRKSSGKVKIDHIKVGEIDRHRSFKSTYLFKGINTIQKSMDAQASMKTVRGAKPQTISTNYMKGPIQIPVYNNPSKDDMDNILKALCENMLQGAIESYGDDAPESFVMFINSWNSGAYSNLPEWKITGGHKITVKILDSIMKDLMTAGKATELDTIRQVKSLFIKNHNESSDLLCGITIGRDIITDIKYMKELFNLNPDIFNHNVRTMNNIGISKDTIAQINEMYCESLILDDDTYIFCIEYPDVHNEYGSLIRIPECVDNLKKLIDNGALSEKTDMRISEYFTGFVDNNSLFSKWYKQHQMGNNCQTSDFIFDARDSMLIESTMDESVFTEAEEDEKPEEEKDILDEPIEDDTNQQDPPPIEDNERNDVNANNMPDHSADSGPADDSNTTGDNTARPQDMDKEGNEADRGDGQGDSSTISREGLDSKVGGEPTPPTIKTPISRPKQFANQEQDKNGVRRKNLYIEFIRWAKEYNPRNIFGSNFDKDIFTGSYPFVPDEMRYFYRLADPTLCILAGGLTFFPVIQLRKLNAENKHLDQYMIFAATDTDMRVFSNVDKRVYMATEQNGEIVLGKALANTFDTYIQIMIDKGDILNGPREDTTLEYVEDME